MTLTIISSFGGDPGVTKLADCELADSESCFLKDVEYFIVYFMS